MVDDIAARVVDDVVGLPIIGPVDVEVVPQKVVLQRSSGAKLADGEDIRFHIADDGANAFVLALCVVVGLEAVGETTVVVAVIQQVVLHHGEGVLGLNRKDRPQQYNNREYFAFHFSRINDAKLENLARYLNLSYFCNE